MALGRPAKFDWSKAKWGREVTIKEIAEAVGCSESWAHQYALNHHKEFATKPKGRQPK